jgi:serine phosphatase RsbU (regulator of sigma subunit)
LEWSVAERPIDGERVSGDMHVVVPTRNGILVGVVDGLGHGEQAEIAARTAVDTLRRDADVPITELTRLCHEESRRTRGVALSLASFHIDDDTMCWLGVGNVAGILFRANQTDTQEGLLLRGGVVGYHLPSLHARTLALRPGDTLVLATDGIHGDFSRDTPLGRSVGDAANDLLIRYGKTTDDALVLVARYAGAVP